MVKPTGWMLLHLRINFSLPRQLSYLSGSIVYPYPVNTIDRKLPHFMSKATFVHYLLRNKQLVLIIIETVHRVHCFNIDSPKIQIELGQVPKWLASYRSQEFPVKKGKIIGKRWKRRKRKVSEEIGRWELLMGDRPFWFSCHENSWTSKNSGFLWRKLGDWMHSDKPKTLQY